MPYETKATCDKCGGPVKSERMCHGKASKDSIRYEFTPVLEVQRWGPVNSVSEPVQQMEDDIICISCYYKILKENLFNRPYNEQFNCVIVCPFLRMFGEDIDCPYLEGGYCDEIDVNCGNGDAWCSDMIDKGISNESITKDRDI